MSACARGASHDFKTQSATDTCIIVLSRDYGIDLIDLSKWQ